MKGKTNNRIYYLVLGSNIEPEKNLKKGVEYLCQFAEIKKSSSVWETEAIGSNGPNFLNAAVQIATHLSPEELKNQILRIIEAQLGRIRAKYKSAPRTIDIDIAIVDHKVIDNQVWTQLHFARPLSELLPDFQNNLTGETLLQANQRLTKTAHIKSRPDVSLA